MRRVTTAVSPLAALVITWMSLQSLSAAPPDPGPAKGVTVTSAPGAAVVPGLVPELGSIAHVLVASSSPGDGATVPPSIREVLIASGTVLLVPDPPESRGGL